MEKSFIILLDLDEVLADFVGGALAIHGVDPAEVYRHWEPGRWSCVEPIGKALGDPTFDDDRFWQPIHDAGMDFWLRLQPTPWLGELIAEVEQTGFEWYVVSSPSRCPTSYDGKVRWLKRQFGSQFDRFSITPHKYLYAQPGRILVDDRDSNVAEFVEQGGAGITLPRLHNRNHLFRDRPMALVRRRLAVIKMIKGLD